MAGPRGHFYVGNVPVKGRCVTPNHTFDDVINLLADGCIHRVFVCSESSIRAGRPIADNVLTQTNILTIALKYLAVPAWSWEVTSRG